MKGKQPASIKATVSYKYLQKLNIRVGKILYLLIPEKPIPDGFRAGLWYRKLRN